MSEGETMFLTSAIYPLTSTWEINKTITVVGEGFGYGGTGTIIEGSGSLAPVVLINTTSFVSINNLMISETRASNTICLKIIHSMHGSYKDIFLSGGGIGLSIDGLSAYNRFFNLKVYRPIKGILINTTLDYVDANDFIGLGVYGGADIPSTIGIHLVYGGGGVNAHNYFSGTIQEFQENIYLEGGVYCNVFDLNWCGDETNYAVYITNDALNTRNVFRGGWYGSINDLNGDNFFFIPQTYNRYAIVWGKRILMGNATGTSPITVEHGLTLEAEVVLISVMGTTPYKTSWDNINATHFNIYHDAGAEITVQWWAQAHNTTTAPPW